tara:strand:- start:804 stop:1709 length:906 start_codon:yes stop_codon:yes gene_type:complete
MRNYIIRKIKTKQKNNYTHTYTDKKGKSIKKPKLNIYIAPAYRDVKINLNPNAKVLAIGKDERDRPQYIYNPKQVKKRCNSKFKKLINFGKNYDKITRHIEQDFSKRGESKNKQIAMILKIIMDCNFRIGNDRYTRDNNSFGVSTLTCKHVKRKKNLVLIDFIGKKGVRNTCVVKNKKIRNNLLTQKKKKQSDDRIFIHEGVEIKSTDVNEYLKRLGNYTTKNFRTWGANTELIHSLLDDNDLSQSVDIVAQKLHHTSAICKKNYIDPKLIQFYERNEKKFKTYFRGDVNKRFTQFLSENY